MFGGHGPMREAFQKDVLKPKRVGETLARLISFFRPYWWVLIIILGLMIFTTWVQVVTPDLTGQVVDCYLTPATRPELNFPGAQQMFSQVGQNAQTSNCWYDPNSATLDQAGRLAGLGGLLLKVVGLYVAGALLTGVMFFSMNYTGQQVLRSLRLAVFDQLHRLSFGYYSEHESGDLMSRITNDAETIQQTLNFALINVLTGALLVVWVAYTMLTKSWAYALLGLAVTPLMVAATVYFSGQARKAFRVTRKELGSVNAELQESITSVREVQAFSREKENLENFRGINAANRDANIRAVGFTSALSPTLEALGYVSVALVAGVGGLLILRNQSLFGSTISLGLVVTFMIYTQRFNQPIQQIATLWTNIQNAVAGAERMFNLLDTEPELQDAPNAQVIPQIKGRVEFVNVSAAYKDGETVLDGINFTALPGQTIAVVGPTGAGKSTLVNLIPRFYDVTGGAVLVDGFDVRNVTAESLRSQIGMVLQDTFMFSDTVLENIRFGRPGATEEEVIAAAKLANADEFIQRLPEKYHTVLGERGSGLSQGQRQLLSIARAALSNPRILILDEATSSVDTRTERMIQKALEELLQGRTSFVIAHRLSTIRNADLLLVLDQGKIIECGCHEDLLAAKGFYYDLYMSQFRRNLPDETARL